MVHNTEAIVIGAGVVGLACAKDLARMGIETIVLESECSYGQGTSSRNSEVIHAGIYYPENSLKASLCVEGRSLIYDYCENFRIPYKKIGKLIVASSSDQSDQLEQIFIQGKKNGCTELEMASSKIIKRENSELRCSSAIFSPMTGIIDSHALMTSFIANFEEYGGTLVPNSKVIEGEILDNGIKLRLDDSENTEIKANYVVNSMGLHAIPFLKRLKGFPLSKVPEYSYAKGSYFSLLGNNPFTKLIYPVPEKGGLGIHLTIDLHGNARFGPDVEWVDNINFDVPVNKREKFYQAIRQYWPSISKERLSPSYSGIRPKIGSKENTYNDFMIQDYTHHNIKGLINLLGIESPGLTSSLSIANYVTKKLLEI